MTVFSRFLIHVLTLFITCLSLIPHAGSAGAGENCRPVRGLVVLVEFPGTAHNVDRGFVEDRFFGKLNSYVQNMSYGQVCIGGDVTRRWYRLPHSIDHYRISPRNLDVDKTRITGLIDDVFKQVGSDYDLPGYDFIALMLGAQQQEYGMIGLCAYPGMLGWQEDKPLRSRDGKPVRGVAIFSYKAHLGTLFHDVAHIMGGIRADGNRAVPCLYDHDLQARPGPLWETFVHATINMGFWDPMSCHYYKRNAPPPGISSWTKLRLGWLPEKKVAVVRPGETREILLGPLEDGHAETLAIRIPLSSSTYFLVENRQPIGPADSILPGSGVLIMRADDSIGECRHGRAPVKLVDADPTKPHLEGAAFDLGKRESFTDATSGVTIELLAKIGQSYRIRVKMQPE